MTDGRGFERLSAVCAAARLRAATTAMAAAVTLGGGARPRAFAAARLGARGKGVARTARARLGPVGRGGWAGGAVPAGVARALSARGGGGGRHRRGLGRGRRTHGTRTEGIVAVGRGRAGGAAPCARVEGTGRRRPAAVAPRDGRGLDAARPPLEPSSWRSRCSPSLWPDCCGRSRRVPPPWRWARLGVPPFPRRCRRSAFRARPAYRAARRRRSPSRPWGGSA